MVSLYIFDQSEDVRTPIIAREIPIERQIDLFQLPELAAYLGTEILAKDFLTDAQEDITAAILSKLAKYKSQNEHASLNISAQLLDARPT